MSQQIAVVTVKSVSLWCAEGSHDKLYRLEMSKQGDSFDVFCVYGRRGGKMTMHVWKSGVGYYEAQKQYLTLYDQKIRKGYREIAEDVMEVGQSVPTRKG